ncbi:hypothetical protein AB2M62_03280 [Sphingomonas sp. MMS12-HWE2-04]|uniref:hypothetical protein n=1 Tax=Sphingomonas sp. MMS12-HWE2-04 TaxID=3234199 RepID=UPI00384F8F38
MSFNLPKGAREFFGFDGPRAFAKRGAKRDGSSRFLLFDAYYCCLLLGLDDARLGEEAGMEADPFLGSGYPEAYKGQAELIAGLLVDAELRRLMIDVDDREDVERKMVDLLDLTSPTRLSVAGDNLLNQYAVTGFDRLHDGMYEPDNLEDFMVGYYRLWSDQAAGQ